MNMDYKGSSRMDMGYYALNKLASSGAIMLILALSGWIWPNGADQLSQWLGISMPHEYWVYGYALTASLVADAILSFIPLQRIPKQAALYGATGFLFFALFLGGPEEQQWARAIVGALTLLMFLWGKHAFSRTSLVTLFFALIIPLLCWVL
ncbi:hypothetical protein JCM10914A_25320 [Paenibacillus sp. JCM 10914]|uniref:hypothetical protein n=1 Tax=Paenibacillus sp. JCM 10914 TaxID=1236974 RepID=UPI0003CC8EA7|nr:hypothetical protein [Paenibacillus sp. JCM 10914]GAE09022.1 hypothetical protein JCM10914_5363 [Paenibacillus sp. JCM 10914]